jgi:glucokinase
MTVALAVDLGGTKIEAALVDDQGRILDGTRFREPTGRESSSEQLTERAVAVVERALAAGDGVAVAAAGIGSAGPITLEPGLVSPLNLPSWRDYPLRDLVHDVSGLPVTLRMDGEAITLAEHWLGAAPGARDLMGMVVSTGVGGGLILGGVTVAGPTGNAGHIGHVEVGGFDDPCLCGGHGCLEAVASGPNTVAWARREGFQGSTGEDLAKAYAQGDPIAVAAVRRAGRAIGQAIASATALVDLEVVAIGGGFSHVAPDLLDIVRATIAERAPFPFVAKVRVVPSGLSGDGPLIGAAALVHRAAFVS